MIYTFKITQLKEYTVEVSANNRDQALEKASEEMEDIELGMVENKGNIVDTNYDMIRADEEENDDGDIHEVTEGEKITE